MKIISKDNVNQSNPTTRTSKSEKSVAIKQIETSPKTKAPNAQKSEAKPAVTPAKKSRSSHAKKKTQPQAEIGATYLSDALERFFSLIRFNITFKLTLGYAIRLILLIVFLFIFIYASFSYFLYYNAQLSLSGDAKYLESILVSSDAIDSSELSRWLEFNNLSVNLYDKDFINLYTSGDRSFDYNTASMVQDYDIRTFPQFPDIYATGSLLLSDGKMVYYAVRTSLIDETNALEATFPIGFVLCIVLILSSIRSASKMSKKHLSPILIMTEQVKDMSANNLSTRLNVSGTKDELKDLALTFNQMLTDIQKSYEREKQFVSDASHELRTPIAVIKGYAGMLNRWGKDDPAILEESIQAILGETDNMHSLVESLLFIARNDKGALKMDKVAFNFSELFCEIIKETRLIDSHHKISETTEPDLHIFGSADKLKQALRIFIDNSIKYTPDDGEVKLSIRHSETQIIITIADDGIGISKEDLPFIFDRFYRADKSRTKLRESQHGGTGLGLSIAKIIIEQHDGKIHVDSELNTGTTFTIFLPRLPQAAQEKQDQ